MQHKEKIAGLLENLHEKYATSDTSAEQDALMTQLQAQLSDWQGPPPADGSVITTAELLIEALEENHPHISGVLRELVDALGRIGI
ncbi:MAG: DUF4404 family protein [Pseudomonadales bacterium]|jgi:hypothetical protein|nr:DUF4404 family protein [Pseudomonadales bacterium]